MSRSEDEEDENEEDAKVAEEFEKERDENNGVHPPEAIMHSPILSFSRKNFNFHRQNF